MKAKKQIVVSGKRKRSIAKAYYKEGKGNIFLNGTLINEIDDSYLRTFLMEPVELSRDYFDLSKYDVVIKVNGGGKLSQLEASRLALAKLIYELSNLNPQIKQIFEEYDRHLLVADVRYKEQRKPNRSKARAKRQKSYR